MDEFSRAAHLEWSSQQESRRRVVWLHAVLWGAVNLLLVVVWLVTGAGFPWFVFPLFGWLIGLAVHAASVYLLRGRDDVLHAREAQRRRQLPG